MPYIHDIDPILVSIGGVHVWWYGLSYTLGFLNLFWWLRRHRDDVRLSLQEVYALSLFFSVGVLLGGRLVEVALDEWPFYRDHPTLIPAYWLGGMATHGLLIGAGLSTWAFCRVYRKPFRELADAIVVPGAFLMGVGRIGNFIDGQIVGSPTDGWWGVKFPGRAEFRHPVVLYDGLKNLLLVPYLVSVRKKIRTPGATAARFVFWYAALRILIDLFRDYPTHRLALGVGQTLNIVMALLGVALLIRSRMRRLGRLAPRAAASGVPRWVLPLWFARPAFAAVLLFSLALPSNWTQDVPSTYGGRHPGLKHSWLYPQIDTAPTQSRRSNQTTSQ